MDFASVFSNKLKNFTQSQSTNLPTMLKSINDPKFFPAICPQFGIVTNLFFLKTLEKELL